MKITSAANINSLWASLLVEELVRNGVKDFCISPGSRSSPLTVAVAQNPKTKTFIHFDERGCAFYGVGLVSASKNPCAIICTSGTAAANLYPGLIEASKKKLPLIVLTADRPPELRFTGAHQTIDQVKMFGNYVRWSFDMPAPTIDIAPAFVLTTVDQALAQAKGSLPGPVHLNCMFREPLAPQKTKNKFSDYLQPIKNWQHQTTAYTQYVAPDLNLTKDMLLKTAKAIKKIKSGIIVVGKLTDSNEQQSVLTLAQKLHWPIFTDISSGLRLGTRDKNIIHYFDHILLSEKWIKKIKPDGILHLGGRITSKRFYDFIEQTRPKEYIMVLNHSLRNDPSHVVTIRVLGQIKTFCHEISKALPDRKKHSFLNNLQDLNTAVDDVLRPALSNEKNLTEIQVARLISEHINKDHALFLASSLPIREMDMFACIDKASIPIGANRGASGIDGTLAAASGFAIGLKKPTTLLIGDLAFLYDLNSLSIVKNSTVPLTIVILNNNGGGIFSFLPIAKYPRVFEKYFGTPHDFDFLHVSRQFHCQYFNPKNKKTFIENYKQSMKSKSSSIIEITSNRTENVRQHRILQKKIVTRLNQIT